MPASPEVFHLFFALGISFGILFVVVLAILLVYLFADNEDDTSTITDIDANSILVDNIKDVEPEKILLIGGIFTMFS